MAAPDNIQQDNYDAAVSWCRQTISRGGHDMMFSLKGYHNEIDVASERFDLPVEALHSLFRNAHVAHLKRTSHQIKSQTSRHVQNYLNGMSILNIAKKCNYPPSMMARLIIENVTMMPTDNNNDDGGGVNSDNDIDGLKVHGKSNNNPNTNVAKNNAELTSNIAKNNDHNQNTTKPVPPSRKFITEAMRYPKKVLGCASTSIIPQYLFSEKKGDRKNYNCNGNPDCGGINLEIGEGEHKKCNSQKVMISRLAMEVKEAIDSDPMYGPRHDKERHNIGNEYELLLEHTLRSMDIPFETEADLRARGTARTPDILLSCPVGLRVRRGKKSNQNLINVTKSNDDQDGNDTKLSDGLVTSGKSIITKELNTTTIDYYTQLQKQLQQMNYHDDEDYEWKIICWIDSKALFGDIETHTNSVLPQVETYVHRFGPGLVLYWFGHAPLSRLGDGHGDVVIVGGDLPDLFLMPTGEFRGKGGLFISEDGVIQRWNNGK